MNHPTHHPHTLTAHKFLILVLTMLSFTLNSVTFAQITQDPIAITLNPRDDIEGKPPALNYEIKPTKSREDVLTVRNNSKTISYQFQVYAADAIQSSEGGSAYTLSNQPQNHIGNWVSFAQSTQTVAPGQTLIVPYQITIPAQVTPGTYQGGLIVQLTGANSSDSAQIKVVTRLIEPIIVSIPGRKTIDYSLDDFSYEQIAGTPNFYLKFSNKGNVLLRGEIDLHIAGTLLNKPYSISLNHPTILQDSNFEKSFSFRNPPLFGSYQADLDFQVYQYDVNKEQFVFLNSIHKSIHFRIVPYGLLIAFILLLVLIILAERWRGTHLQKLSKDTFIHKVKKGETIASISAIYQVDWHTIIKMNHLKRPYTISAGDTLILPFPEAKTSLKLPH